MTKRSIRGFLSVLFAAALACSGVCAADAGNAAGALWDGEEPPVLLENGSNPPFPGVEYHWIKRQESDGVVDSEDFLLGVTIEEYHGRLLATWAYDEGVVNASGNRVVENTIEEETWGAWSEDGGATWGPEFQFLAADLPAGEKWATSHGVSFVAEDTLYYLLPCYQDRNATTGLRPMRLELHRWAPEAGDWEFIATCAYNFWPNSRPVQLENGKWFLTGCVSQYGVSGYAVSNSSGDLTSFTVTPTPGTGTGNPYFNESSFWIDETGITLVARNNTVLEDADPLLWGETMTSHANRRYPLMLSRSTDGAESFSTLESSGFYTSRSRIFCGRLSDGRPYLLFNQSNRYNDARRRLLLGIGDAGTSAINRIYTVEDYSGSGPGGGKGYPFAVEADGKLYVSYAYSVYDAIHSNRNHARLAVIPLSSIPEPSSPAELEETLRTLPQDSAAYTDASFAALETEAAYARAVAENSARTASQIDMAVCRLRNALNALEPVEPPEAPSVTISVQPSSPLTRVGETFQLEARTVPEGAEVAWTSSDTSVATVDETGRLTAVGAGSTVITAETVAASAQCTVRVELPPSPPPVGDTRYTIALVYDTTRGNVTAGGPLTGITTGSSVTLTVRPYSGYRVKQTLLDDAPVALAGNALTLSDIRTDHTVSVEFAVAPAPWPVVNLSTAPEEPVREESGSAPFVLVEALTRLEAEAAPNLRLTLPAGTVVDGDLFEAARRLKRGLLFDVSGSDGTPGYRWSFAPSEFEYPQITTALRIDLSPADWNGTEAAAVRLSFAHWGRLPGRATLALDVSDYFAEGTRLIRYRRTGDRLEPAGECVVTGGCVTLSLEACEDEILAAA